MPDHLHNDDLPLPLRLGVDRHANVIQELLGELHASFSGVREGRVADYIPELAKACPDDFGIVIATSGGRIYEIGDTRKEFTIQSISKPFIYALALKTLSFDFMASKIDVEPSGEAFNAISLDPESGKPRNPMINAGAIAASAQICDADPSGALDRLLDYFESLAGRRLTINEDVYRSEKETGHRNRAIGHLLRNFNIIESDPEPALDLYFRQCAISVTCSDLAVMAATLACQGRNPFTGGQPLSHDITVRVLALMGTCGMYDFAGQWLHDVGIPAKSGVAGGVLAVIPGRLGIATYSPPLDNFGNSVRGVAVCRQLSVGVGLSLFNQYSQADATIRRSYQGSQRKSRRWRSDSELEILTPHRDKVRIIHVQGVLDFGGIEQLASELVLLSNDVRILILDLAHVTECPMESFDLLDRQLCSLEGNGVEILLSRAGRLPLVSKPDWAITDRIDAYEHLDSTPRPLRAAPTVATTLASRAFWRPSARSIGGSWWIAWFGERLWPVTSSSAGGIRETSCSWCVPVPSTSPSTSRPAMASATPPGWPPSAPGSASARSASWPRRPAPPTSSPPGRANAGCCTAATSRPSVPAIPLW